MIFLNISWDQSFESLSETEIELCKTIIEQNKEGGKVRKS